MERLLAGEITELQSGKAFSSRNHIITEWQGFLVVEITELEWQGFLVAEITDLQSGKAFSTY